MYMKQTKRVASYRRRYYRRRKPDVDRVRFNHVDGNGIRHKSGYAQTNVIKTNRTTSATWTVTPGQFNGLSLQFILSALPNNSQFAIFDQYRVTGVDVHVIPRQNVAWSAAAASAGASIDQGPIIWAIDWDDAQPPASADEVLSKSTANSAAAFKDFHIFLKPKPSSLIYGAQGQAYGVMNGMEWINMSNRTVPYYGVKLGITPGGLTSDPKLYIDYVVKYYIQLRIMQ